MKVLQVLGFLLVFSSVDLRGVPVQETKCNHDAYPPPQKDKVDTVVINLDLEPEERWKEIAAKMKPEITNLLQEIKNFTDFILNGNLFYYIEKYFPDIVPSLPDPYGREIKGIASATGLPLGDIVLYNIFYEVTKLCTSIIAETPQGLLYHARNLDFGLFLGWDVRNNTWALAEVLRPLVVNFDYQRGGKTVYLTTGFAGFVGAFTGIKPGIITITMNSRLVPNSGFIGDRSLVAVRPSDFPYCMAEISTGMLEWIMGKRDSHWTTFLVRDLLDSATGFDMAEDALSNTKIMASCYYILGGNSSGQGVVITRDPTKSLRPMRMNPSKGTWFLLQTNYDHWKDPLVIDDRRTPGKKCMTEMTQKNVGVKGVFNVLSTIPVLNKLTSYTAVMQVNSGTVTTYLRFCRDPCFPW